MATRITDIELWATNRRKNAGFTQLFRLRSTILRNSIMLLTGVGCRRT
jgi:hypothetical protein